ncbi:hypothetical protein BMW24_018290 [Mycobacterium heckeshornense]|uniref:Uncharacterized protein n=1 Tax=Mycobacterium heckeshornense TaxID=110505 RepID=A0A2G8B4C5_9MYCO|nr:hypothetical protein [Mycobacterium heckeshornense]MCV7034193.1 hypothetical protein [Mycobacterium heckeshornense]PIJ32601.1 hypothetical protein BMW24_018290 [Mycobacterium heckeshornense]BCO36850.1 hypothetical protein MHEC_32830 [Mycobacterium heckeshornense]
MPDDVIGDQYPQPDPRGWLVFTHLPADLQRAEDATLFHDLAMFARKARYNTDTCRREMTRPATDAERTLLQHLGFQLPDDLTTVVYYQSPTMRARCWPQLEGATP